MKGPLELVCPAGTPAALRAAVDAGADVVYAGFPRRDQCAELPGAEFLTRGTEAEGLAYSHAHGAEVYVAINTFPAGGKSRTLAPGGG